MSKTDSGRIIGKKFYMLGYDLEGYYEMDFIIRVNLDKTMAELESDGYRFDNEDEGGFEFYNPEEDSYKKIFYVRLKQEEEM